MSCNRPLVVLDRDGVINHDSPDYIRTVKAWQPIPGSIEGIAALSQAGFTVAVATNQSGLGRGYFSAATLNAMHEKLHRLVNQAGGKLAAIAFCPHLPTDKCACRKPQPGLIHTLWQRLARPEPALTVFVGDALSDLQLAWQLGIPAHLVLTGKGQQTRAQLSATSPAVTIHADLAACSQYLIERL